MQFSSLLYLKAEQVARYQKARATHDSVYMMTPFHCHELHSNFACALAESVSCIKIIDERLRPLTLFIDKPIWYSYPTLLTQVTTATLDAAEYA